MVVLHDSRGLRLGWSASVLMGREETETTGSNGLPLTPSSIRMLGRFQSLTGLQHANICRYHQLVRCVAHNVVVLLAEHCEYSIKQLFDEHQRLSDDDLLDVLSQLISAVAYLHKSGIVIGYLTLESLLLSSSRTPFCLRLSLFGLYFVSGHGRDVDYEIGSPWYLSPENIVASRLKCTSFKSDIWAIGIICLELAMGMPLSSIWNAEEILTVLKSLIFKANGTSIAGGLIAAVYQAKPGLNFNLPERVYTIMDACLQIYPSKRWTIRQLAEFLPSIDSSMEISTSKPPTSEMFYLWKLCGSSAEAQLIRRGYIDTRAAVETLPFVVLAELQLFGNDLSRRHRATFRSIQLNSDNLDKIVRIQLNSDNLDKRVNALSPDQFLISFELQNVQPPLPDVHSDLPIVVKERDIDYQWRRMLILRRLTAALPRTGRQLMSACGRDIAPVYRAAVWTGLLGVSPTLARQTILSLDTLAEHPSDRQLMVDIPRCHQYDELMTSPAAHTRLKRLLKAWLLSHPRYVYWQGLDSLAAPFLSLHFNDLALALGCMTKFIDRYLYDFFLRENSMVIQEWLAVLSQLLSFVDAGLSKKLRAIELNVELYAIPWLLTAFAHVLPLHKLFPVWDALLQTDDPAFPLFIAMALLRQLRPALINAQFNDAILLFSDLPDVQVERVVRDSLILWRKVPRSCAWRSHGPRRPPGALFCRSNEATMDDSPLLSDMNLAQLQRFPCPRLSANDLLSLLPGVLLIDVRPYEEYMRGCLQNSLNYPFNNAQEGDDNISPGLQSALQKAAARGHIMCIVDARHVQCAIMLANVLLRRCISRVCILDLGISSLFDSPLYIIPSG